jgi:fatty-acyl-CoA synthase
VPTHPNPYRQHLGLNAANHAPLTPFEFLFWAADAYPQRLAIVHGDLRQSWREFRDACMRMANRLFALEIGVGDTVSVMLPNIPPMVQAHFAVPMTGAVLHCINTRLDAPTVAYMLEHCAAKVLVFDCEYENTVAAALAELRRREVQQPFCIRVNDPVYLAEVHLVHPSARASGDLVQASSFDDWLLEPEPQPHHGPLGGHGSSGRSGQRSGVPSYPESECDALALNYTSGTTGHPKGVVVHHRGAYLNALSNILAWSMPRHPVYLWTLPMFHCNGWCFPWTIAALAGVNVCLRRIDPAHIFRLIREHSATHYCAAPIVHSMLIQAPEAMREGITHRVSCLVAGAAPPATMIAGMESMGFDLTHVYGLTEVYGPSSVCARQSEWDALDLAERAERNARQGLRYPLQRGMTVMDPATMQEVERNGHTMGEVMFQGNVVMSGYLKDPESTAEAFAGGWFHTGDLGVIDESGYVRLKDRAKDIIISGGENISSIEVEDALHRHPAVMACAVVAKPDAKWGETPLAFVELKPGSHVGEDELIAHCRGLLAYFKCPREVRFMELPKTSTGKIQKQILRSTVHSASAIG